MNLSHLRAGIIGTGFIGPVHLEALKRLGVQVNALCGSRDSALALAKKWGVSEVYGSYDYEAYTYTIDRTFYHSICYIYFQYSNS